MTNASNAVPKDNDRRRNNIRKNRITSDGVSKGYREKIAVGPIDYPFLLIVIILLVMGIIMMFSAGYAWAIREEGGDGTAYVRSQLGMAGIGLVCMFFASFFDYHWFRKPIIAYGFYGLCVVLLILCRVGPFTNPQHDSWRWVKFPHLPSFQPSEMMKLAIIMLFAYLISVNYSKMKYFKYGIVPFLGFLGVVVALMMWQPHLSGTIIICCIGIIMMFVGGSRVKHLLVLGLLGVAVLALALFILIEVKDFSYFENRMQSWLDPFNDDTESNSTWQTKNSLIAIGSGGLFGLGIGN